MGRSSSKFSKKKEGRRKRKSRSSKSKKLRYHDDSFSSCSDDESNSSLSLSSSSSSESEYKRKRSRSRARNEVKSSKKRSRRRYLSEESSEESSPVKKRKRSKKKSDSRKDKKIKKKKKKSRKEAYISSASDSESCSTCNEEYSSSDEGVSHGKSRGRNGNRKSKNKMRTRSSSPSQLSDSYDDENIEEMVVENNTRRLKSVITVVKPPENEEHDDMKKDELKEEIVYDYDDYPSSKSNDSNDGERTVLTSVIAEINSNTSLNDSKEREINAAGNIGSEVGDLELVLRQKALENLSRFRGGNKTKPVVSVDDKYKSDKTGVKKTVNSTQKQDGFSMSPVSQPVIPRSRFTWRRDPSVSVGKESTPHVRGSQTSAPKVNRSGVENNVVNDATKITSDTDNKRIGDIGTGVDLRSTIAQPPKIKIADVSSTSTVKNKIVNKPTKVMVDIGTDVDQKSTAAPEKPIIKSADVSSTSRVRNKIVNKPMEIMGEIGTNVDQKSTAAPEKTEVKSSDVSSAGRVENKVVNDTLNIATDTNNKSIGDIGTEIDQKSTTVLETPSSASTKEGSGSKDQGTETNDSSQFEQKTMSVMRGGEMVQVNYKVYIPTRAPALARRKLKR